MVFWAPKAFLSPALPFTACPVSLVVSVQLFPTAAAVFCCHCMVLPSPVVWGVYGQHLHRWPAGLSSGTPTLPHAINSLSPLCLQSWGLQGNWDSTFEENGWWRLLTSFWGLQPLYTSLFTLYDLFMPESYTLSSLTVSMRYSLGLLWTTTLGF